MKGRKKMTNRLKERFQRFMIGRYGMDQLGQFMAYVVLALILLNFIIRAPLPSRIMGVLEFAGIVLMYGRMFSKNINKRSKENQAFLRRMFYVTEYLKKLRRGPVVGHIAADFRAVGFPDWLLLAPHPAC